MRPLICNGFCSCPPHACSCYHGTSSLRPPHARKFAHRFDRSDIRAVEKMKDLFMKLAELQAESRAPRQEKVESLSKTLESQVLVVTDWFAWVEDKLRSHNEDLEKLVAEYMDKHQQTVEQSNKYLAEGTAVRKELLAAQQEHHMVKCDLEQTNKVINDKYGQLAAEMARLQEELERTRQSSYDELQAERERAAKELQQLRDRMSTEREDADSRGAKELAARIDAERQRFDTELKHLRGEMESASKRAAAVALALQTDLSSARSQIDQLKKELADMTLKADMARVDVARLERDLNQSRERSQELQQALAESAESLGHQLSKVALV